MQLIRKLAIFGLISLILGIMIIITSFFWANFDFTSFGLKEELTEENVTYDNTANIKFIASISDVEIVKSTTDKIEIKYYQSENIQYTFNYTPTNLEIIQTGNGIGPDFDWSFKSLFTWNYNKYTCIIGLPDSIYNEIEINVLTGQAKIDYLNSSSLNINVSTGNIEINNANITENLVISNNTGEIEIYDSIITEAELNSVTGDVTLENVHLNNLLVDVTTGEIELNNVESFKVIGIITTGSINTLNLDSSDIYFEATTGDMDINLLGKQIDYRIEATIVIGTINVLNKDTGSKKIVLSITTGDIKVTFS